MADKVGEALSASCFVTWNVNQKLQPRSASAPASEKLWSDADNLAAVEAEVLRLKPDIVTLQEVDGTLPLSRMIKHYKFLGARAGASSCAGCVHLYARFGLIAEAVSAPDGLHGVLAKVALADTQVGIAALHLHAGADCAVERRKGLQLAAKAVRSVASTVVIFGDLNLRDEEVKDWKLFKMYQLEEVPYEGFSWNPRWNRYDPDVKGAQPMRFDRMFFRGDMFAVGYLAGKRKQFQAGCEFFLSDHFALVVLADPHVDHGARDASRQALHARRAALTSLRDQAAFREAADSHECVRVGREQAALEKRKGRESEMEDVQKRERKARQDREKAFKVLHDAAFGGTSLWSHRDAASLPAAARGVQVSDSRGGILACQVGAAEDLWRALRLSGIATGMHGYSNVDQESCFANSILQVLLRIAPVASWLAQHNDECSAARGECVACLLFGCTLDLRHPPSQPRLVAAVREGRILSRFSSGQHDAAEFLQELLGLLIDCEKAGQRVGSWRSGEGFEMVATHVDRLFAGVVATFLRCASCNGPIRMQFEACKSLLLPAPEADESNRVFTCTELYFMFAAQERLDGSEMVHCGACGVRTAHSKQIALVTAPTLLVLQPRRAVMRDGRLRALRHKVVPELSISLPDVGDYELAAVVYHRGRTPRSGHYFAAVKAHDSRWWIFDDEIVRRFNEDVERYSLDLIHLCVYVRPRGVVSFSDGVRFGDAPEPSAGFDFKTAVDGVSAWDLATWTKCVRAYLNDRRRDVHVVAGIDVEAEKAADLRLALADGREASIEGIFRDIVIAARGEVGAAALAKYDWRAFARAFGVFLQARAQRGSSAGVASISSGDISASKPREALLGEASHLHGVRVSGKRCSLQSSVQITSTSGASSDVVGHESSDRQAADPDRVAAPNAPRLKRYRRDL